MFMAVALRIEGARAANATDLGHVRVRPRKRPADQRFHRRLRRLVLRVREELPGALRSPRPERRHEKHLRERHITSRQRGHKRRLTVLA